MTDLTKSLREELTKLLKKTPVDYEKINQLTADLMQLDKDAVRFSVDAKHVHRLGFELVGKQVTAVGELIKNAYDADATEVHLEFANYDTTGGMLIVRDDGHGMTEEVIRNSWMKLSTADKEDNPVSPLFGRSRAGRKGIGRFAVERLGEKLTLETEVLGNTQGVRVIFDWDAQYSHGISLTLIANKIEYYGKPKNNHGTRLIIDKLRDKWTKTGFQRVWKSVLLLQPPFKEVHQTRGLENTTPHVNDLGFEVLINEDSEDTDSTKLSLESFLNNRVALIKGFVDEEGVGHCFVESEILQSKDSSISEEQYLTLGELTFEVSYFIYTTELISNISLNLAKNMGREYGGVRVYRDGFRVLPYGESKDDWLNFDFDTSRRTLLVAASNTNFFGHVEITSENNPLLEETSSREGLIENDVLEELQRFVRSSIEWAILRIAERRHKKLTAGQKDYIPKTDKPSRVIQKVIEEFKQRVDKKPDESAEEMFQKLESLETIATAFEQRFEEEKKERVEYEAMLRILASLGISIAVFSHETRGSMTRMRAAVTDLLKYTKINLKNVSVEKVDNLFEAAETSMASLDDHAEYIQSLVSHTASREKKIIALSGVIENFIKQFKNYLNTRGVDFEYKVDPSHLRTLPMHRSEIDSVLFNFLTNSIKAMDRDGVGTRKVSITAFRKEDDAVIRFQDTGKGVPEKIGNRVFNAFYTTSTQNRDELAGPGTGLGLKIVSDIAESNGGSVRLSEPDSEYGGCFEFLIPVSAKQKGK